MDSHIFGLWITQTLQSLEVATCILLQREVEEPWVQEWLGKKVHKNCLVFSEVEDSYKKKKLKIWNILKSEMWPRDKLPPVDNFTPQILICAWNLFFKII